MLALEEQAHVDGYNKVSLGVSLPSRKFYEGLGYMIIEEKHIDVGGGQQLDYWHAEKQLG